MNPAIRNDEALEYWEGPDPLEHCKPCICGKMPQVVQDDGESVGLQCGFHFRSRDCFSTASAVEDWNKRIQAALETACEAHSWFRVSAGKPGDITTFFRCIHCGKIAPSS